MDKTLYDLMDWAGIEEIVYSEAADPHRLLGPHVTGAGLLIQAFIPTAAAVSVKGTKDAILLPMERVDDAGFFAVLLPGKTKFQYLYQITYDNHTIEELIDPYSFEPYYTETDIKKFSSGIHYSISIKWVRTQ